MELSFQTFDPTTGSLLQTRQHWTFEKAEKSLEEAWREFLAWKHRPVKERAHAVAKWALKIKECKEELAQTMTEEMGKPISQSRAEIEKCIFTCEYLAAEGPRWLANHKVESPYHESWITYEPLGPILAIMPWNFPLWQVIRFAAPAIIAGNTVLLKHADLTSGCAEIIGRSAADLAEGFRLLQNLPVDHEVAAKLIAHPKVRGLTFTGSTRGGKEVAMEAAKSLKKVVLELGGSDAYVILADADLQKAAKICAAARLTNNGQSCVAAKRFIVERSVAEAFTDFFIKELKNFVPSDPRGEDCKLGPLASKKFQKQLQDQVDDLKKRGGRVLLGGSPPEGPGAFYPSSLIVFDQPLHGIGEIEMFGPVALMIVVDSPEAAISAANDSPYGLGGALFTKDVEKGKELLREMEAGFVVVNDQVKSDVRLPFGGVKESGHGRELSPHGILEFCNIKTVAVGVG